MGAGHSKSQTVNIPNPKPMEVQTIQVTPTVMTRLENAKQEQQSKYLEKMQEKKRNQNQERCECCKIEQEPAFNSNVEREDYVEMMDRMDHILGKAVSWSDDVESEMSQMRNQLIECHTKNPAQPLQCAELAQKFQNFVFSEQAKLLLQDETSKDDTDDGSEIPANGGSAVDTEKDKRISQGDENDAIEGNKKRNGGDGGDTMDRDRKSCYNNNEKTTPNKSGDNNQSENIVGNKDEQGATELQPDKQFSSPGDGGEGKETTESQCTSPKEPAPEPEPEPKKPTRICKQPTKTEDDTSTKTQNPQEVISESKFRKCTKNDQNYKAATTEPTNKEPKRIRSG